MRVRAFLLYLREQPGKKEKRVAINRVKKTWAWTPVQTSALKGQDSLVFMKVAEMKMLGNSRAAGREK